MLGNDAKTITEGIEGRDKYGTAPVRNAFFGLCSTQLIGQLDTCQGFTQVNNYPAPDRALESEWGACGNVRFLISSLGSVTPNASSTGQDVYNVFITGLEAYAAIHQDEYSARFIFRPSIYDGALALNSTAAWKTAFVPRLLNDEWLFNLRCTLA